MRSSFPSVLGRSLFYNHSHLTRPNAISSLSCLLDLLTSNSLRPREGGARPLSLETRFCLADVLQNVPRVLEIVIPA